MIDAHRNFEAIWPRVRGSEAIYEESPDILHVRVRSARWDRRLLVIQMDTLPTAGFAQSQRPNVTCGSSWDELRCTEHGLCTFTWSLNVWTELIAAVVERAAQSEWSPAQYEGLSNLITDWELNWVSSPARVPQPWPEPRSKRRS